MPGLPSRLMPHETTRAPADGGQTPSPWEKWGATPCAAPAPEEKLPRSSARGAARRSYSPRKLANWSSVHKVVTQPVNDAKAGVVLGKTANP